MLRSVFSLIQKIIDSDKEYKNQKSSTVIYLVSNSDKSVNMDLEIEGKGRETIKLIKDSEKEKKSQITSEQGDTITFKENKNDEQKQLEKEYERTVERTTFCNEEETPVDCQEEPEGTAVKEMLRTLSEKQIRIMEKDKDHVTALMEQIQKMKSGIERLQEIAQQFKCSETFKQDIDYLLKNIPYGLENDKDKDLYPTRK